MKTVKELRRRGFQFRRISFSLKVMSGIWAIAMVALAVGGSWTHFFASMTGLIAFCLPALLIAATYDQMAEREFNKAAAANQPLLGVVHPIQ
jgi:hypothetical protein